MLAPLWGHLRSSYSDKWGVPRQSQLEDTSFGVLIPNHLDYLECLTTEDSSGRRVLLPKGTPLTLTWIFNRNNTVADWNTLNRAAKVRDAVVPCGRLKAIVRPPKVDLKKRVYGALATRSPHRPNPIGLSIGVIQHYIRLDRTLVESLMPTEARPVLPPVDSKFVVDLFRSVASQLGTDCTHCTPSQDSSVVLLPVLKGIDLLDGSPILSLQPYQLRDHVISPMAPTWVMNGSGIEKKNKLMVHFSLAANLDLHHHVTNAEDMRQNLGPHCYPVTRFPFPLVNVLSLDPRSLHSKDKYPEGIFAVVNNGYCVTYKHMTVNEVGSVIVLRVRKEQDDPVLSLLDHSDATMLRTSKWVSKWESLYPHLFEKMPQNE